MRGSPGSSDSDRPNPLELRDRARQELLQGRPAAALRLLEDAARIDRGLSSVQLLRGIALKTMNRYEEAEAAFRYELQLDCRSAAAHHNLAELFRKCQRLEDAARSYQAALRLDPKATPSLIGLGHTLIGQRRHAEAADCFQRALAASSTPQPALSQSLGYALTAMGDSAGAREAYRAAVAGNPGSAEAHADFARALLAAGEPNAALGSIETALRILPDSFDSQVTYATTLAALGDVSGGARVLSAWLKPAQSLGQRYTFLAEKLQDLGFTAVAVDLYQKALGCEPHNPVAQHYLAALTKSNPQHPVDGYVEGVFDAFASTFEQRLAALQYTVPTQLADALLTFNQSHADWDVLDLGCGTGLVGAALAAHSRRLVGADLSANMLEHARRRNLYSRLICRELTAVLHEEAPCSYDVVTAADVFIYVGSLEAVVPAVRSALRPGGLFAFSVEALEHPADAAGVAEDGYRLRDSGRYAHSVAYLESLADRHDFAVREMRDSCLRWERNAAVRGWIAVWSAGGPTRSP